ncbi:divalent-cation tolerance protein CutA [Streptomyces avidinii]|uniref:Periplasmic divalent cation tolerance protein n=1 Tax=Streptomyces avidinii TaxID=1895 RepID=A0ABS4L5B4_STRAV|nr:divalent-cation tolerance protein CutA [Streptomyces avidinii]MBP2037272.1 periplasmic divalent cation tolerance protein [Streptomyces avidinii]GGY96446.1 divalent cation tolerance protein [Streptomyces avidinii]
MASIVIVQTTVDDEDKAYEMARAAVEARLAAGVHVDARMTSFYWWKDAVQHEREYRLSFKTTAEKVAELQTWVHERHPYEVPQWIVLPTTAASEEYLAWVVKETRTR